MDSRKLLLLILALAAVIAVILGFTMQWGAPVGVGGSGQGEMQAGGSSASSGSSGALENGGVSSAHSIAHVDDRTPEEKELARLTEEMIAELQADGRLSLSMVPQLRTYRDMLALIQSYARKVEQDLDIIKEISKGEFQENVELQAALFSGKKPDLVAKHLEEFRAGRVGAILAKMKEKEASAVMDVWAGQKNPTISRFYRQVVEAYLKNKRRDLNPENFAQFQEDKASGTEPTAP